METWRSERLRAREIKQREVYAALVRQLYSRFTPSTFDIDTEAKLRAEVVTWGSPKVVIALSGWISAYDEIVKAPATREVDLSPAQQETLQKVTGEVAAAVRGELTVEPGASTKDLIGALFNKTPS